MTPRPWRLTRRQRVEKASSLHAYRLGILRRRPWQRPPRWIRLSIARSALVLRAELRADEDARCEEALGRSGYGGDGGDGRDAWWTGWDTGYDEGAEAMSRLLRDWPALPRGRVPLALWERPKPP